MRMKHAFLLLFAAILATGSGACTARDTSPTAHESTAALQSPQPTGSAAAIDNGYDFGSGTYYVATRRKVPRDWGNAASWYQNAQRDGYKVSDTPKKGAIAWTNRGPYGQVAIVEEVLDSGRTVRLTEMNGPGGWNRVTTRTAEASFYKYIL